MDKRKWARLLREHADSCIEVANHFHGRDKFMERIFRGLAYRLQQRIKELEGSDDTARHCE